MSRAGIVVHVAMVCTDAASRNHVEDVRERAGIARELKLTMTKSPAQRQAERSAARAAMEDETNRRRAWCVDGLGMGQAAVELTSGAETLSCACPLNTHPTLIPHTWPAPYSPWV